MSHQRAFVDEAKRLLRSSALPPGETFPEGVTETPIAALERRFSLWVPRHLRELLLFANGPCVGPGGFMGIEPSHNHLDIAFIYGLYPHWADCGWIPVAGDGCGNYYVVVSRNDFGDGEPVVFVDTMEDAVGAAFLVASCTWHFVRFILLKDRGQSRWPFASEEVIAADPDIRCFRGVDLPWET